MKRQFHSRIKVDRYQNIVVAKFIMLPNVNVFRIRVSRIRLLHVAWVRPVGELCVAAATAATAAGPRGETHFRKRL